MRVIKKVCKYCKGTHFSTLHQLIQLYPVRNCIPAGYLRLNRGPLLLAQLGLSQHFSRLLTGGGVHVEVLEEDLGATGGWSATFGVVLGLEVDGVHSAKLISDPVRSNQRETLEPAGILSATRPLAQLVEKTSIQVLPAQETRRRVELDDDVLVRYHRPIAVGV